MHPAKKGNAIMTARTPRKQMLPLREMLDRFRCDGSCEKAIVDLFESEREVSRKLAEALWDAIVHPIEGDGARWNGHNRKIHAALAQYTATELASSGEGGR